MNLEAARTQMVEQQVRTWEVLNRRVLDVLATIRREAFVPEPCRGLAFADANLPLAHGQVMMAPKVEGRLLQALDPGPDDAVLEIGTGSGFLTACLARLSGSVRSLDIFPDFIGNARAALESAGIRNVTLETADASRFASGDRFDAIALTCSLPVYEPWFEQALTLGGRLFVIVGQAPVMEVRLVTRVSEREWYTESLFETVITAMINAPEPPRFVF